MFEIGLNNREKVIMYSKEGESNKKHIYCVYVYIVVYLETICLMYKGHSK